LSEGMEEVFGGDLAMFAAAGLVDCPIDDPLGGLAYFALSDVEVVHGSAPPGPSHLRGSTGLVSKRQARNQTADLAYFGWQPLERGANYCRRGGPAEALYSPV
jgi:hypothetical protein